jgi:ABC-type uncharacterized transport system substrate-binding protein
MLDSLPGLAVELVRAGVEVIVTAATPATFAAKRATGTIPIVKTTVGDAVASGELPTKFELLVNLKTASRLGIRLPRTMVFRADRVIE